MMAKNPRWGRYHWPDDDHRKGDPSLGKLLLAEVRTPYRRNPRRNGGIAVGSALLIALGLVAFLVFGIGGDADPGTDTAAAGSTTAAAAPTPRPPHQGNPIDSAHPEPEQPLPPDNPAVLADEAVAREQPDFSADDQQITDAVAAAFGSLTTQQKADTMRCVAEFAERVYAQKHSTIPPDEADGQPGFGRGGG